MKKTLCLLVLLLIAPGILFGAAREHVRPTATVTFVYDGDTVKLSNGEKVRLLGIDTPEARENDKLLRDAKWSGRDPWDIIEDGKKATEFTRALLDGQKVQLEYDVETRDKYGRLLAYLYLEDGTFVNAEIIKAGYAEVMVIPPNMKYSRQFHLWENEAREQKNGLWA